MRSFSGSESQLDEDSESPIVSLRILISEQQEALCAELLAFPQLLPSLE